MVSPAPEGVQRFRPEIQGLRTVAVVLVVLFHLWPNRVTGGYVGVDVFFVISGFLITSHIHREVIATGTVSLRRFWARRIRRLLPASLLVLAVSAVGVVALLPPTLWAQSARQIAASALYVQNWALAADAVDYMAADNVPTIAQHYWSLSVEEQFYIIWPVLILALLALHRWSRGRPGLRRGYLVAGLGVLTAVSLVWSIVATYNDQASAYFITPTRAWEFATGAILALVAPEVLRPARWRGPVAWAGVAAIMVAGLWFDGASMFPGWIALLPVLGTAAVIAAGGTASRLTPAPWLSLRPMTFVGDISYSVYLWHWPLIIVWPYVTGVVMRSVDKVAIFALTIVLAWLSKIWVEDPARTRPLLAAAPWRSFAFAGAGMAVVVVAGFGVTLEVDKRSDHAAEQLEVAKSSGCFGPQAMVPANRCTPVEGSGQLVPPPEVVDAQNRQPAYPGCQAGGTTAVPRNCELGAPATEADRVVALVGDSHATQWFPAFDQLGKDLGWQVLTFTKSGCPFTASLRVLPDEQTDEMMLSCQTWNEAVRDVLVASDVSYVFTAAFSTAYGFEPPDGLALRQPGSDGFIALWSELADAGIEVFAIADVPRTQGDNVPNCLAAHPGDRMACSVPRSEALPGSALVAAATGATDERIHLVDLTDQFCDAQVCYPVVGDLIVYRDYSHIAVDYSLALVPYLDAVVPR